ncbi:MAG: fimbrillin family protein [Rikenellaceae bacterium]
MKRLITSAALMAAVALSSCSTETAMVPEVSESNAIKFSTFLDTTTKGAVMDDAALSDSGFGVFGYYTEGLNWSEAGGSSAPDFMFNQSVTKSGSAWTYSPTKFWSNVLYDNYTFFAYAPYAGNNGVEVYTSNSDVDAPRIKFTVNSNPAKMVDFVAGQVIDAEQLSYGENQTTVETPEVTFNLKHQLSRVSFTAKTNIDAEATTVVITGMEFPTGDQYSLYENGIYTFDAANTNDNDTDHDQDGTWSFADGDKFTAGTLDLSNILAKNAVQITNNYSVTGVAVANTDDSSASHVFNGEYLFLLPPNGAEGMTTEDNIIVNVTYDIYTADASLAAGYSKSTKTATVEFPNTTNILKQGKAYNLQLTIDLTAVELSASTVEWDDDDYSSNTGTDEPVTKIDIDEQIATAIGVGKSIDLNDFVFVNEEATYPEVKYAICDAEGNIQDVNPISNDGAVIELADGVVTGVSGGDAYVLAQSTNPDINIIIGIRVKGELTCLEITNGRMYILTERTYNFESTYDTGLYIESPVAGSRVWTIEDPDKTGSTIKNNSGIGFFTAGTTPGTVTVKLSITGAYTGKVYEAEPYVINVDNDIESIAISAADAEGGAMVDGASLTMDFEEVSSYSYTLSSVVMPDDPDNTEGYSDPTYSINSASVGAENISIVGNVVTISGPCYAVIDVSAKGNQSQAVVTDQFAYTFVQTEPEFRLEAGAISGSYAQSDLNVSDGIIPIYYIDLDDVCVVPDSVTMGVQGEAYGTWTYTYIKWEVTNQSPDGYVDVASISINNDLNFYRSGSFTLVGTLVTETYTGLKGNFFLSTVVSSTSDYDPISTDIVYNK